MFLLYLWVLLLLCLNDFVFELFFIFFYQQQASVSPAKKKKKRKQNGLAPTVSTNKKFRETKQEENRSKPVDVRPAACTTLSFQCLSSWFNL